MPPESPTPKSQRPPLGSHRAPATTIAPDKTDAQLRAEADIAIAREKPRADLADTIHEAHVAKELDALAGTDLDFDIERLITDGSISKKGIPVLRGKHPIFCDMHTLTTEEDILLERLIVQGLGPNLVGREYTRARGLATMAMAITRFNREKFHNPDPRGERDEAWETLWNRKLMLFLKLLKADSSVTEALALIYQNLENADLLGEDVSKKSEPQPEA